jgi:HEAT repeat protein
MRALLFALALLLAPSAAAEEGEFTWSPDQFQALVASLQSPDVATRVVAAEELKAHPAEAVAQGAVAPLAAIALSDPSTEAREAALWALAEMGPGAYDDAAPSLLQLMEPMTPQPGYVQGIAAYAYGRMDPPIEEAWKHLLPLLMSMDEFTQRAAGDAVGTMGAPMLPMLLVTLQEMNAPHYTSGVMFALEAMGEEAAPAIPVLLELQATSDRAWLDRRIDRPLANLGHVDHDDQVQRLIDENEAELARDSTRYLSICELGDLGPAAAAATPTLMAALDDPHTARVALEALVAVAPPTQLPAVVDRARPMLALTDWEGFAAAGHLAACGEAGRDALVKALSDSDPVVRSNALSGLAEVEPDAGPDAFKPLKRLLDDDDGEIRSRTARCLAHYGDRALPLIERALQREDDPDFRADLVRTTGPLGEAALPLLLRELRTGSPGVQEAAAWRLGEIGPAAVEAVPDMLAAGAQDHGMGETTRAIEKIGPAAVTPLLEALKHDDPGIRERAAYALGLLREGAAPAVTALARALNDPEDDVRQWSAWSLGRIGPEATMAVDDLRAALYDPESWVRRNAAESLGKLGPEAEPAIPDLVALVERERNGTVSDVAIEALTGFGPTAVDAVPVLVTALDDDFYGVRVAAARALAAIGTASPEAQRKLRAGLDDEKARVRKACAEALLVLGTDEDIVAARLVIRRAPDEIWEQDLQFMESIELPEPIPPPIEEPEDE